jgi:hypothetical protein
MEIYVETVPSACDECPCCNSDIDYGACCNLGAYGYVDYYPTTRKHPNCPLKLLTDRLAEEFEALKETFVWGRDNGYLTPKSAVGIVENKIKDLRGKNE